MAGETPRRKRRPQRAENAPPELKPFKSHEAHQYCDSVLVEAHAIYWAEVANEYMEKGYTRQEAAALASSDFREALAAHACQVEALEVEQQRKIKEAIDLHTRNTAEVAKTHSGGGRRRRGQGSVEQTAQQTEMRNKLADSLSTSPSGRRRRAKPTEHEGERLAREGEALIAYHQKHLAQQR